MFQSPHLRGGSSNTMDFDDQIYMPVIEFQSPLPRGGLSDGNHPMVDAVRGKMFQSPHFRGRSSDPADPREALIDELAFQSPLLQGGPSYHVLAITSVMRLIKSFNPLSFVAIPQTAAGVYV